MFAGFPQTIVPQTHSKHSNLAYASRPLASIERLFEFPDRHDEFKPPPSSGDPARPHPSNLRPRTTHQIPRSTKQPSPPHTKQCRQLAIRNPQHHPKRHSKNQHQNRNTQQQTFHLESPPTGSSPNLENHPFFLRLVVLRCYLQHKPTRVIDNHLVYIHPYCIPLAKPNRLISSNRLPLGDVPQWLKFHGVYPRKTGHCIREPGDGHRKHGLLAGSRI